MAVLFAIAAALLLAVGSTLQHAGAIQTSAATTRRGKSLISLVTNRLWLSGVGVDLFAYAFEIIALSKGRLSLVQPLLALGLVFALPMSARRHGSHHPPWRWIAALCVAAGVTIFVLADPEAASTSTTSTRTWAIVVASVTVVAMLSAVGALVVSRRSVSAMLFALGSGVSHGLTAALTKACVDRFHHGPASGFHGLITSWFLYALLVGSLAGLVLGQAAFRSGPLGASLPTLTVTQRVVGTGLGLVIFGEHATNGSQHPFLTAFAALLAIGGIAALARPATSKATRA